MRSRLLVAAALASAASVSGLAAQEPKKSDTDNKTVTLTGCLDGGYLRVAAYEHEGFYNDRFRLAGPKHLLKEIASQQHRYQLEVTGRVTDARGTEHVGRTTKMGERVTAYVGGDEIPPVPTGDTTPTLQVLSYRETSIMCTPKQAVTPAGVADAV